ncbi:MULTISPECIES: tripartite tricarboxylate transporter TctB family protein [Cupriavidus]|uniref:Tripartite tricarboxylate transporter TctB family protein n=1 Tax=Cupriavidus pauculus TaxID=82633 RepID=A0A3G8H8N5_9BURK|nr:MULTISPECIES: tripartite tricarboxylate transporter TctB family protein [Cupriavidus]AZG15942.1 tripartite tricarboxylate transporter TctB family protein [Cupriavidus pauculus]MDT6964154.1 tripartite tricarboxylate transporter TctB family protein [Cupriavidus sp. SZY C1]
MHDETHEDAAPAAISVRAAEIAMAVLIAAGAVVVMVTNYGIGAGWAPDGPQAGYFPLRIGALIFIACLAVLWTALRTPNDAVFVTWPQLRQVAVILVPLTVYVALIGFLGIYVASAIFIAGFMLAIGKFAWWRAVLTGVVINAALFWIFEMQFRVPLPKGPLEAAFGF